MHGSSSAPAAPAFAGTVAVAARPASARTATSSAHAATCRSGRAVKRDRETLVARPVFQCTTGARLASSSSVFFAQGVRGATRTTAAAPLQRRFDVQCSSSADAGGQPSPAQSKKEYWFSALNPLIYAAAVIPVLVGTAAARWDLVRAGAVASFSWTQALLVLIGEVMLQAWLNISNDVYDSETGVDNEKHDSFVNLTGKPAAVQAAALACLALGAVCVAVADRRMPNRGLLKIAAAGVAFGYMYQGPPFRFSYKGIGEPMTFFAFGPLATLAASQAQLGRFSVTAAAASLIVGFMVTSIIFAHHFHQVRGDKAAGKVTPVVRLGPTRAAAVFGPAVVFPVLPVALALVAARLLPARALLAVAAGAPAALKLVKGVRDFTSGASSSKPVKKAVLWHLVGGLALTLALWPWSFLPLPRP